MVGFRARFAGFKNLWSNTSTAPAHDPAFDAAHKELMSRVVIPAIGIPSLILVATTFSLKWTVLVGIALHFVIAGTNAFLSSKNSRLRVFGRILLSRSDEFDYWRWVSNVAVLNPLLYYLLMPSPSVHFAAYILLAVMSLLDTYRKDYRLRVVGLTLASFSITHMMLYPDTRLLDAALLISAITSLVAVVWAIESKLLGATRVIADAMEREGAQRAAVEKLEIEAAIGQQTRVISHEINNLITTLAMSGESPDRDVVARTAEKLRAINSLVLEASDIERIETTTTPRRVLADLRLLARPMTAAMGCRLEKGSDPSLLDHEFVERRGSTYLIMHNLIKNACEAMVSSGVRDGLVEVMVSGDSDSLMVSVRDHGPGFAGDLLDFGRAGVRSKNGGHGIGLRFVADQVKKNGFELSIRNAPDGGCECFLRIPARPPGPSRAEADRLDPPSNLIILRADGLG